jgi:hypothetical protein
MILFILLCALAVFLLWPGLSDNTFSMILKTFNFANPRIDEFKKTLSILSNFKTSEKILIFLFPLLSQLAGVLAFILLLRALHIYIPPLSAFWIMGASAIIQMMPIHIAGFGVREASLVFFLSYFGVPGNVAIALSFGSLGIRLFQAAAGGIIELFHLKKVRTNG